MGFYAPAQIVRDARDHGVEVRHHASTSGAHLAYICDGRHVEVAASSWSPESGIRRGRAVHHDRGRK